MTHQKFMFDRSFDLDDPTNKEIEVIEEIEEEPEIIIPTFSEEEVESARNVSFENGRVEGFKEAKTTIENQIASAIKVIGAQLDQLTSNQLLANREIFRDAIKISRAITVKSFPSINKENGFQEIENLIHHVLAKILEEPRVKIQVHPILTKQLSERISQISENTHFEGRVNVLSNEAIKQGDCKIEWSNGGAERDINDILFEVDTIINNNLRIADDGYDPSLSSFEHDKNGLTLSQSSQSSESPTASDTQSSLNEINQPITRADDVELAVSEREPQTGSNHVSMPTKDSPNITQETAIDQYLEVGENLDKNRS